LKTKQALVEIKSLRSIAEVANKVSKERAPANKLMSSNAADFLKNQKNLKEYRLSVDRQLNETIHILKEEGYTDLANTLDTKFRDDLKQARAV
ncbi:GGDEF domain-containing protein, partial [Acinetobacter johnsonii]